jgi:hypothetical protein
MADLDKITKQAAEPAERMRRDLERSGQDGERRLGLTQQAARLHDLGKGSVAFQALAEFARQIDLIKQAGLTEQIDAVRKAFAPPLEEMSRQIAGSAAARVAGQAAPAALADYAQRLGAEQGEAVAAAFGKLHAETWERIAERVRADSIGDVVRQLNTAGLSALADIAGQAGEVQRRALDGAISTLREYRTPALQGVAEQLASLGRERLGEVGISELRDLTEQLAAVGEDIAEPAAKQALNRATEEVKQAMLAPAVEAARAIEEDGRFASLDALDAATAYWSASYAALPKELRSRVEAPAVHLTPEQSLEEFDRRARRLMNISGEEFVRRWEAGEFRDRLDHPEHPEILELVMLLPLVR